MRAARLKGDCVICQAPEAVRKAVNAAIWHEGSVVRIANYRAAGCRAASQIAMTMPEGPEADRYTSLDPKTITRHADHIEESWREVIEGDVLEPEEVPILHEFGDVMDKAASLGMLAMGGLRDAVSRDPEGFAWLKTKEAIALAKVGVVAAGAKENTRLKRNQQKIDVMAIFAASSGHLAPVGGTVAEDAEASIADLHAEIDAERSLLEARNAS